MEKKTSLTQTLRRIPSLNSGWTLSLHCVSPGPSVKKYLVAITRDSFLKLSWNHMRPWGSYWCLYCKINSIAAFNSASFMELYDCHLALRLTSVHNNIPIGRVEGSLNRHCSISCWTPQQLSFFFSINHHMVDKEPVSLWWLQGNEL